MMEASIDKSGTVVVSCAFCHGTGKDSFGVLSWLSACCVCQGRGRVTVPAPYERCAHCNGTGAIKTLTCTSCRGKGVLPALEGPTEACPECGGSGDDRSAPAMGCLTCRGRGRIPVAAHPANTNFEAQGVIT
jgi:DnaJ-class molecular chaperone